MPSKKTKTAAASAALPTIPKELIDQFVTGPMSAEAVNAASVAFKKALIERALGAELGHHLGYAPGAAKPPSASNHRNGASGKTVLTDDGPLRIEVPRDREGSFEPLLIPKHERRFSGFDDKIVAMYARGMTVREVQGFLAEQYGVEVSPEFISSVTDAVMAGPGQAAARSGRCTRCLLRCAAREDPRGRSGAQQGDLSGTGRAARRHARHSRALDREH
jgi:transposase-like protein